MEDKGCGQNTSTNNDISFTTETGKENGGIIINLSELRQYNSIGRRGSPGASLRRLFNLPTVDTYTQLDEDAENESVSMAGDIGDRELLSRRASQRFQGSVFPASGELFDSSELWCRDPSKVNTVYPISPSTSGAITSVSTDLILLEKQEEQEEKGKGFPPSWQYVACLIYLSVFAILGVLSSFLLQKLFGPSVANVTSDHGILYFGLPANMIGSFLMGWVGVVFKPEISRVSDQLVIGLTSGYLGSLTAFSGWNQQMVELSAHGHWHFAALGFIAGLFLSSYSFNFGIETAKGFRWILRRSKIGLSSSKAINVNNLKRHVIVIIVLVLMWASLWAAIGVLAKKDFTKGGSAAQLWLACFIGPVGVWIRWWLARLNGRGLGKAGLWKWIPFGTLIANVSSASIMAALATLKKAVKTKKCDTVATAIQMGFLGCLSTVPAFIAEFNAMRQSSQPWRAYAYAIMTIGMSFGLGTLIYSVPFWTKGYN